MANFTGSIADAGRLIHLAKRRERQKEDIEKQKQKIQAETSSLTNFEGKFKTHYDAIEQTLKSSTVGLVTLDQMKAKQENYVKQRELQLAHKNVEEELKEKSEEELEAERRKKREEQQKRRVLTFDPDEAEEDDEEEDSSSEKEKEDEWIEKDSQSGFQLLKRRKIGKDPTVDTSFLPDKDREEQENRLREQLRQEWAEKQEEIKNEEINIAFSYWDGSGHRRDSRMKKGHTIGHFLQKAMDILRRDFNELKVASPDSLMFVKEDLIIPHFYTSTMEQVRGFDRQFSRWVSGLRQRTAEVGGRAIARPETSRPPAKTGDQSLSLAEEQTKPRSDLKFYDFIVTKAMGKTGPLFEFDAAGELRVRQDAVLDTAESHPAKVVLRSWYERNKHIYPASRWEPFVPNKKYDKTYEDLSTL